MSEERMDRRFTASYSLSNEIQKLQVEKWIKDWLRTMKGKLILPKDHQTLRNKANIYVESAEDRSGLYRICYIRMEKDRVIVCEYKGSRGDQYSAYYKLLVNYLKERNVAIENTEQFELFESALPIFIECINLICKKGEEGQYRLLDTGKTYTRISNRIKYI